MQGAIHKAMNTLSLQTQTNAVNDVKVDRLTRGLITVLALVGVVLALVTDFGLGALIFGFMLVAMAASSAVRYQDRFKDNAEVDHWVEHLG